MEAGDVMQQRTLDFDTPRSAPERESRDLTIQERFEIFDRQHPDVWELFRLKAERFRAEGRKRIGAKRIFEDIRADHATSGKDREGWKLNNVFASRYARKLIESDPIYASFLELRELKSK